LVEWEKYVFVYQRFNDGARLSINSFTSNTNIYAFNLTMGIAGLGSLWISHPKLRLIYAPLGIIFAAAIVLTVSKTSMLAIAVYGGIYVAISLYFFLRKFPKTLVFIYATGLVGLTLFVTNLDQMNLPFLNRIYELMTTSSDRSFSSRVDIWLKGITMFQADNTLLGYGFGLSNTYLGVATAVPLPAAASSGQLLYRIVNDRFHNGFLEILVSYGLIGTLLLTIAHWEYFKALVNLTKRYWIAIPMWSLIISFAVQMMFEDRILFRPDLSGIFFMTMLILPLVKPEAFSNLGIENKTK
jgi:O-antigen ligase